MKKLIICFLIMMLCVCTLAGCVTEGSKNYETHADLIPVPGRRNLYYDSTTRVVYFLFNESIGHTGYGYMSPYYSSNGSIYIYDGDLKEVE